MAYNFIKANQQRFLSSEDGFSFGMPFTMSAKVRTTVPNTNNQIISVQSANLLNAYALGVNAASNSPFATTVVNNAAQYFTATTIPLTVGIYSQIAITYEVNRRTFYRNFNSQTNTAGFTNPGTVTRCSIGARPTGPWQDGISEGDIAEVGIWNVALTQPEIASLSRGMTCNKIRPQNLVFYAPLVRDLIDTRGRLIITNNDNATVADNPRIYA